MTGALYDGDNLQVLRDEIASATVDFVYLAPPFIPMPATICCSAARPASSRRPWQ